MLAAVKGKLIVSCQALEDEPLHSSFIMGRMALAAKLGGAIGIRAQGVDDIKEIMSVVDLPVIGIIKRNYPDSEVFITPTKKEVQELCQTDAQMIALDATLRERPNGEKLEDLVNLIHQQGRLAMADCSTLEEALYAEKIGFDCVSSTLAGYTDYSINVDGPNYDLLKQMINQCTIPVIAEGKINTPEELKQVMNLGVHSAVVGGAITRPLQITQRFMKALEK
jgi:N-acylglucosamine-6-phosphate 2-epimerase